MPHEQLLLIVLQFPIGKLDDEDALDAVFELQDILKEIIDMEEIGRFDGNEFCEAPDETSVTFFIYGSNADKIQEAIIPILDMLPKLPGSYIFKQYGNEKLSKQIFL
jgi:hypothetical protein